MGLLQLPPYLNHVIQHDLSRPSGGERSANIISGMPCWETDADVDLSKSSEVKFEASVMLDMAISDTTGHKANLTEEMLGPLLYSASISTHLLGHYHD